MKALNLDLGDKSYPIYIGQNLRIVDCMKYSYSKGYGCVA
jgi:hypothetical protein